MTEIAEGRGTLPELFAGRSQLMVGHFMFHRAHAVRGAVPDFAS